jgi:UDPglucose 6-dehydrogenase
MDIQTRLKEGGKMKLSVIGLGKLGACSAACFASKGFEVTGVDVNRDFVDAINQGKAPLYEPRLQELITAAKGRLRATQDFEEAIKESDITFLIVPTPSKEDGNFSDKYLQDALNRLSLALKETDKKYHLFVITSTVSPGTTEENLIPLIESVSGKALSKGFGVCYNPEFIALGNVINNFLNPDFVLIGESDRAVGAQLAEIYRTVCENKPYIARMSIISAEIAKISLNAYVTMKISFANTLANICEAIPGTDIDAITKALGSDKRISPYFLKGGLSYGGPCFPRDNRAFAAFAKKYDAATPLAKATDEVNQFQIQRLVKRLLKAKTGDDKRKKVAILGLSYKPNTPVIEESAGVKIIEELLDQEKEMEIIVYDPLAMENARAYLGEKVAYASSVEECFSRAAICIITTPANEFKLINEGYIAHNPTTIIDCWRLFDPSRFSNKVRYIALGRAS